MNEKSVERINIKTIISIHHQICPKTMSDKNFGKIHMKFYFSNVPFYQIQSI